MCKTIHALYSECWAIKDQRAKRSAPETRMLILMADNVVHGRMRT